MAAELVAYDNALKAFYADALRAELNQATRELKELNYHIRLWSRARRLEQWANTGANAYHRKPETHVLVPFFS